MKKFYFWIGKKMKYKMSIEQILQELQIKPTKIFGFKSPKFVYYEELK